MTKIRGRWLKAGGGFLRRQQAPFPPAMEPGEQLSQRIPGGAPAANSF